jgi:hypothetical protein
LLIRRVFVPVNKVPQCVGPLLGSSDGAWASGNAHRPVRLAYQPPVSNTFLSEQTSHQQPTSSTFLSEQTSTGHQPPAKRTGCMLLARWRLSLEQHSIQDSKAWMQRSMYDFMHNSSSRMEIYNISLLGGQIRVNTLIAYKCYNNGTTTVSTRTGRLFTISSKANKLTAIGCYTLA